MKKSEKKSKFFIIGIAFKGYPETSDLRGSNAIEYINLLKQKFSIEKNIFVYDAIINKQKLKKADLKYSSINKGFQNADVVMIMNNHETHQKLEINKLLSTSKKNCIFFDGWNLFDGKQICLINESKYLSVGSKK